MYLVTHVLNGTLAPHNQRLSKIRIYTFPLGVDTNQLQLRPAPIDHVCDTQIELAGHDDGLWLACQGVEEVEGDGINLVVDVEALDILPVILHDDVDEVVYGDVLVSDEDFAVEDLVVAENVVDHLLIEMFRRRGECDFHSSGGFRFEVDIAIDR